MPAANRKSRFADAGNASLPEWASNMAHSAAAEKASKLLTACHRPRTSGSKSSNSYEIDVYIYISKYDKSI